VRTLGERFWSLTPNLPTLVKATRASLALFDLVPAPVAVEHAAQRLAICSLQGASIRKLEVMMGRRLAVMHLEFGFTLALAFLVRVW
jgi:hypothetical protein